MKNVLIKIIFIVYAFILLYGCYSDENDSLGTIEQNEYTKDNIIEVTTGDYHSLVLTEKGRVFHFGLGKYGLIIEDDIKDWLSPLEVTGLSEVKTISAGGFQSLFVLKNGEVYSSGFTGYGYLGHEDDYTLIPIEEIETEKEFNIWLQNNWEPKNLLTPKKVEGLSNIKDVSAGEYHSLVLTEKGKVYSFGSGESGQLGHGDRKDRTEPKKIEGLSNIKDISAGGHHSLVLTENGEVYSFGSSESGQLGHGDRKDRTEPKKIEGLSNIKDISAGGYHSLALNKNGKVYSFGLGNKGQLGRYRVTDQETQSTRQACFVPSKIEELNSIEKINAGVMHSVAFNKKGEIFSFGSNHHGSLGHGDRENRYKPKKIEKVSNAKDISASFYTLMLLENGDLYSFGYNEYGQLGHGNQGNQLTPKKIDFFN